MNPVSQTSVTVDTAFFFFFLFRLQSLGFDSQCCWRRSGSDVRGEDRFLKSIKLLDRLGQHAAGGQREREMFRGIFREI